MTYGVVRRDAARRWPASEWGLVVADEAQHAKNPLSSTARSLRALPAGGPVALTGTPVENRLTRAVVDPGLDDTRPARSAGGASAAGWRSRSSGTGSRGHRAAGARWSGPFLLRRRKSDPGIAPELPPKTETDVRRAAHRPSRSTLYEAVVRETMAAIARSRASSGGASFSSCSPH